MRSLLPVLLAFTCISQSRQNLQHELSSQRHAVKLAMVEVGFVASPGCSWRSARISRMLGQFVDSAPRHGFALPVRAPWRPARSLGSNCKRRAMPLKGMDGMGGARDSDNEGGRRNKRFLRVLQSEASNSLEDALNFISLVRIKMAEGGADAAASFHVREFNNAIKSCSTTARRGSGKSAVSTALRVFDLMREVGVEPNSYTFVFLMDTCAKAGAEEEAVLVAGMLEDSGCSANEFFYSSYISLYKSKALAGDRRAPQKVLNLLDEMKRRQLPINEFVLTSAISTCAAAANKLGLDDCLRIARNLLSSMDRSGVNITEAAYNALMSGCAKCAADEPMAAKECWKLLKEMKLKGLKPNQRTYNTLMDCCARCGDLVAIEQCSDLIGTMQKEGLEPDTTSYNTLLKAFASAARKTIEGRKSQSSQNRGRIGSTGSSRTAARGRLNAVDLQREAGDREVRMSKKAFAKRMLEESFQLVEEMKSRGLKPDVISFNTLLAACAAASAEGRQTPKRGLKALQLMKEADVVPSADSFSLLMEACKVAELAGAKDSMEVGMRVKEFISNPQSQFYSTSLASSFPEKNGNVYSNETLLDAGATWMHSRLRWDNAVSPQGLIDAHETARIASSMSSMSESLVSASNNPFYARNIVSRIVDASATANQVRALAELARTSAETGDEKKMSAGDDSFELGMQLFLDMLDQNVKPDAFTFTSLINTAKQNGNPEHISRVYNLFRTIPYSDRNHRMYATMIGALGQARFVDEAVELLSSSREHGLPPDLYMYSAALQAAARAVKLSHQS
ncbi:hypothetical protein GUITHDRAFT_133400 [Guillardia theta CCMP2712]|uniref:PROP1-like PPR domain-containing protein n=1 Tax=Guillardia theta (strain CCMP2712) TaxID=905079 RepID=L1JWQ2_GUITC|nr:hypothetical protein GUITHDRAFT_133400 [Guillardia theta CCMP2712]EKX53011.1 hypothetical protein GUITHDRAFT_133400 [Guillardia theta CCMP2712]|eukprot:XP_005839991.1 hypothetical protein GUITHDRAFT_133400 [Guillardia theta CCMP2712]